MATGAMLLSSTCSDDGSTTSSSLGRMRRKAPTPSSGSTASERAKPARELPDPRKRAPLLNLDPNGYAAKAAALRQCKPTLVSTEPPRASPAPAPPPPASRLPGPPQLDYARRAAPPAATSTAGPRRSSSVTFASSASDGRADATGSKVAEEADSSADTVTVERSDFRQLVKTLQSLREQRTADLEALRATREALGSVSRLAILEAPESVPLRQLVAALVAAGHVAHAQVPTQTS